MKPDPKWSFVLTVLLFAGLMIGLSLSVLNDLMSGTAELGGRQIFVMSMHVIWLVLWSVATVLALKFAFRPRKQSQNTKVLPRTSAQARNPATSEY